MQQVVALESQSWLVLDKVQYFALELCCTYAMGVHYYKNIEVQTDINTGAASHKTHKSLYCNSSNRERKEKALELGKDIEKGDIQAEAEKNILMEFAKDSLLAESDAGVDQWDDFHKKSWRYC